MNNINILTASKQLVIDYIDDIIAIENRVKLPVIWTRDNVLSELDSKWIFSRLMFDGEKLIAFAFVSRKTKDSCHIHRFVVDSKLQRSGFGLLLLSEVEQIVFRDVDCLTLCVDKNNLSARCFYEKSFFKNIYNLDKDLLMLKFKS